MKYRIVCLLLALVLMLFVAACAAQQDPATLCKHDYRKMSIKDGTCLVNGSIDWQCILCGEKKVESVPGKHAYTCTDTRPATCASEGLATYTCSGCKETYTEPIAKIDHIFDEGQITTAASCKAEGVKTFTCSGCNATYTEKIAKTEHKYDSGKVTTAATCTAEGVKTFSCSGCNATYTEKIAKTEHKYDSGKVTTAATCTTEGVKTVTCTACGHTYTETVAKNDHDFAEATCVNPKTCRGCGITDGDVVGHNYQEIAASDGHKVGSVITYTCGNCAEAKEETISKISISADVYPTINIGGWYQSVGCDVTATGGYGTYQYKYEIFTSETATTPGLTEEFSDSNYIGWSSRFYCNGHVVQITVRDEAGNEETIRVKVE